MLLAFFLRNLMKSATECWKCEKRKKGKWKERKRDYTKNMMNRLFGKRNICRGSRVFPQKYEYKKRTNLQRVDIDNSRPASVLFPFYLHNFIQWNESLHIIDANGQTRFVFPEKNHNKHELFLLCGIFFSSFFYFLLFLLLNIQIFVQRFNKHLLMTWWSHRQCWYNCPQSLLQCHKNFQIDSF